MSDLRFEFGRNWKAFSRSIDEQRIESSISNLKALLQEECLDGRSFLDIGCGSGLSSVAAVRMGAQVHGFDYDQNSVDASLDNLSRFCKGKGWKVEQGSALDKQYMESLGAFDVVYSWGVLHHTGKMWVGIDEAAQRVKAGGKLALAIYNDQGGASRRWHGLKKTYVKSPAVIRFLIVLLAALFFEGRAALVRLVRLQNPLPFSDWRKRREERGMAIWHDLVDWVGGYPFEVAKPEEVFDFLRSRGFRLEGIRTCAGGHGCNEFLFSKNL